MNWGKSSAKHTRTCLGSRLKATIGYRNSVPRKIRTFQSSSGILLWVSAKPTNMCQTTRFPIGWCRIRPPAAGPCAFTAIWYAIIISALICVCLSTGNRCWTELSRRERTAARWYLRLAVTAIWCWKIQLLII
ncbi:hypothetical protein SDC9_179783 [bioreactor metagenome]|uniref:Uncharacterized protein n=1 Tax=bioreactor metagenome TaxID=1076179 RepID=A0A645GZR9_9ZZZZ